MPLHGPSKDLGATEQRSVHVQLAITGEGVRMFLNHYYVKTTGI
jgi:hypothetical protein